MSSEAREYIITLKNKEDLESFYNDMELSNGAKFIPHRAIPVKDRRPVSRNTHYTLYASEAELIKNDPRVLHVELSLEEQGLKFKPFWTQASTLWNRSNTLSSSHRNWGILRSVEGVQRSGWGTNGTTNVSGTVNTTSSGKYVDVVIVDGHFNPLHPEFAVNADGSGGSRVVQYNWLQHNLAVLGTAPGTYAYTPYIDPSYPDNNLDGISDRTVDGDHGTHVASTACGNTYGWARDANIYNISPYSTNPSNTGARTIDYIREWHRTKPINPATGRRNPTVTNHSYGVSIEVPISEITIVRFQGTEFSGPFTESELTNYGLVVSAGNVAFPIRSVAYEEDLIDAMNEGIIVVGAAGNDYTKISNFTVDTGDDYNNYIVQSDVFTYYYNRGPLGAASGSICVGGADANTTETKIVYSNCGPRIDLYAPGRFIVGGVNSTTGVTTGDSRNSAYRVTKRSGTSMSSPQVAGVLACLAEQWPTMKQSQARDYIRNKAKIGQITATTGGIGDYTDLQGSTNRFLYYNKERLDQGMVGPKVNQGNRSSTGHIWPRTKIYRYGR
jgi:hypothetical protein